MLAVLCHVNIAAHRLKLLCHMRHRGWIKKHTGDRKTKVVVMENFLRDKDIWLLGSVCLMATFLWRRWWKLFSIKKRGKTTLSADQQVTQQVRCDMCYVAVWKLVNLRTYQKFSECQWREDLRKILMVLYSAVMSCWGDKLQASRPPWTGSYTVSLIIAWTAAVIMPKWYHQDV